MSETVRLRITLEFAVEEISRHCDSIVIISGIGTTFGHEGTFILIEIVTRIVRKSFNESISLNPLLFTVVCHKLIKCETLMHLEIEMWLKLVSVFLESDTNGVYVNEFLRNGGLRFVADTLKDSSSKTEIDGLFLKLVAKFTGNKNEGLRDKKDDILNFSEDLASKSWKPKTSPVSSVIIRRNVNSTQKTIIRISERLQKIPVMKTIHVKRIKEVKIQPGMVVLKPKLQPKSLNILANHQMETPNFVQKEITTHILFDSDVKTFLAQISSSKIPLECSEALIFLATLNAKLLLDNKMLNLRDLKVIYDTIAFCLKMNEEVAVMACETLCILSVQESKT